MTVNVFACSFFVQWKLPRGPHKLFVLVAKPGVANLPSRLSFPTIRNVKNKRAFHYRHSRIIIIIVIEIQYLHAWDEILSEKVVS